MWDYSYLMQIHAKILTIYFVIRFLYLFPGMKFINQFRFYYVISLMGVELDIRTEEQSGVGKKVSVLHLFLHIEYELLVSGRLLYHKTDVPFVAANDILRIHIRLYQSQIQVEQIPSFLALVQRTQFRAEQLGQIIGRDVARTGEPLVSHNERQLNEPHFGKMLEAVDFDLQSQLYRRGSLGLDAAKHRVVIAFLFRYPVRKEAQHLPKTKHNGLDRAGRNLHEINVFTVSYLRKQMQFVQSRTAPECQLRGEKLIAEDGDQRSGYDKVLLDV